MLAVVVLMALVLLRVVLLFAIAYLLVPHGRRCPACGAETVPLRRTGLVRLVPGVERRWCLACGWSWFRKRLAAAAPGYPAPGRTEVRPSGKGAGWSDQ